MAIESSGLGKIEELHLMIVRSLLAVAMAAVLSSVFAETPTLPSAGLKQAGADAGTLSIPPADVRSLIEEDSKAMGQAMRYGFVQRVDQPLLAAGETHQGAWQDLADGRSLWTLNLESPGAVSLDLQFSRLALPDSAELYLANARGDYVLGPIRGSDVLAGGQYYSHLIPGDAVRVEVVAAAAARNQVEVVLAGVTYGYRGILGLEDHAEAPRSGSCNIDVVCPLGDGWGDQIDSVGQYIFTRSNGSFVCTGSLIGNTSGTPIPYFLTANHCVSTDDVAQTMRIYWNYQSPTCRTPGSAASGTPLPRPATFSNGASLRMTYASNDTSMVELNAPVPASENPFFVGWDRRDLATPGNPQVSNAVTIHHPAGHEKRISLDEDALSVTTYLSNTATPTGSHYRIGNWEEGTTEGGSSGSALYTPEGHLIGTLHGGYASCSSNTQDWYGRIYQSWAGGGSNATRLSNWLDPEGTAPETFDGYRGEPLPEADLALTLTADPTSVEIGESTTITALVEADGPDDASDVEVTIELPVELIYDSFSGADWNCSAAGATVTCTLMGILGDGDDASVDLLVTVDSNAMPGMVEVSGLVASADNDPNPSNNEASVEVEITGLPELIFANDFECANGLPDCPIVDPDIVTGLLDVVVPDNFGGLSVNWLTGDAIPGEIANYHFNPYRSNTASLPVLSFWWGLGDDNAAGVATGSEYAVLQSGAEIGPTSVFITAPQGAPTINWRQAAGVDGYLGFRFTNTGTGQVNYGYVRMTTTGTEGFPATLLEYAYNQAGDSITIP